MSEPHPSVFRNRGFRVYLVATTISAVGDFLYTVGLLAVVYDATRSSAWVGATVFARVVAWAVGTAAGGVLGDRVDRRRVIVGLNVVAGLVVLALAVSAGLGAAVVVLVSLATLLNLVVGLLNPSLAAAVPSIVGEDDVATANAAVTTVEQVSTVAGPALGALLVTIASPTVAFALNSASFLVAAWLFTLVPRAGSTAVDAAPGEGSATRLEDGAAEPTVRFRDGIAAVRGSRSAAVLLSILVAALFGFGFEVVLFVLVAVRRLGFDSAGAGYLTMATGVGGVVASLFAARVASQDRPSGFLVAVVLSGVTPVALSFATSWPLAFSSLIVGGGAYVVVEVFVVTQIQRVVPDELLARVFGLLMSFGAIATAAGSVLAPLLEHTVGLRWAVALSGVATVVVTLVLAPSLPAITRAATARRLELAPKVDVLAALAIFSDLDDLALERLAAAVTEETVEPGTVVLREGDPADDLFIVRSGVLDVRSTGGTAAPARFANAMGPGDWFGEIGLIERLARTATVTATTRSTLWRISGDVFLAALEAGPAVPDALRLGMVTRLARTHPSRRVGASSGGGDAAA